MGAYQCPLERIILQISLLQILLACSWVACSNMYHNHRLAVMLAFPRYLSLDGEGFFPNITLGHGHFVCISPNQDSFGSEATGFDGLLCLQKTTMLMWLEGRGNLLKDNTVDGQCFYQRFRGFSWIIAFQFVLCVQLISGILVGLFLILLPNFSIDS